MTNFLSDHLTNLTSFAGREARGEFWPYAGIIVLGMMAANAVIGAIAIEAFNGVPDFEGFVLGVAVMTAIIIGLLASAVVRRLHDTGRSGLLWGLLPIPFLSLGLYGMW